MKNLFGQSGPEVSSKKGLYVILVVLMTSITSIILGLTTRLEVLADLGIFFGGYSLWFLITGSFKKRK